MSTLEEVQRLAKELKLNKYDQRDWEFLVARAETVVFDKPDDDHSNPNTRVACLPINDSERLGTRGWTELAARTYFNEKYPTGRVAEMFKTALYWCQRVRL